MNNTDTSTPGTPNTDAGWWIAPLAAAGMALAGAGHVLGAETMTILGAAMLLIAAGAGIAQGWVVGLAPKPNTGAAAAAAAAEVRRVTVMAPEGERELDVAISAGNVVAARWPGGEWGPAELVG
ncbi:hypothetical protein [Mycolicibacterium fallax]|uniref:Uncharacterized protein n=1 Tax=Mycolicibacterium fallax TaxID=1793 RepID=A0A1X1QZD8_MYCFA|nr:hypothetical protein [Mycolicibacterium fallax]ORU96768.1 hypothetical protein AWC04_19570 [Mycolicibacterium fallax]BBY97873.1 hypothetical protein MFAL_13400 [Mycolicibacterium fallax]